MGAPQDMAQAEKAHKIHRLAALSISQPKVNQGSDACRLLEESVLLHLVLP